MTYFNEIILVQEPAFENVFSEMAAVLSRLPSVTHGLTTDGSVSYEKDQIMISTFAPIISAGYNILLECRIQISICLRQGCKHGLSSSYDMV